MYAAGGDAGSDSQAADSTASGASDGGAGASSGSQRRGPAAVSLALGGWNVNKTFAIAGVARILAMLHDTQSALAFDAPFASVLGQTNAVALSMFVFGLALCALAGLVLERRWQETRVGLAVIVTTCLLALGGLYVWSEQKEAAALQYLQGLAAAKSKAAAAAAHAAQAAQGATP